MVRNFETKITINESGFTEYTHKAVTLFNDNLVSEFNLVLYQAKDTKSKFIKATIYDENGIIVRKIKKSDMVNIGDFSNFSSDAQFNLYELNELKYPCTIEYEYETTVDYLFILPAWQPVTNYGVSVEKSSLTIHSKEVSMLRFYEKNLIHKVTISKKDDYTAWQWSLTNFVSVKKEKKSLKADEVLPLVLLAPSIINYQNYTHDFVSWKDLGEWIKLLNKDKDILSPDLKEKVHQLTDTIKEDYQKIKTLYEFMQNNTRYVSVQYGIGGFRPFEAKYVYERGYGDCKALSNYMFSMLKEIGIKAYYTLVKAGENNNIVKEFPASQFNHAILCVPLKNNDTLWLENTSQKMPFAYNGDFTDDRDVLLISEIPAIAHTNIYTAANNKTINKIEASVLENGSILMDLIQTKEGLAYEDIIPVYNAQSTIDREKMLQKYFKFGNAEINNINITENKSRIPSFVIQGKVDLNNFSKQSSNRLFIPISFIPKEDYTLLDSLRKTPFYETKNYIVIDSVQFNIPDGFKLDSKEIKQEISNKVGDYQLVVSQINNTLKIYRNIKINKAIYRNDELALVNDFYKKVKISDAYIIILKKLM
ncbi:MAG: DUF3857 domain-containing protein [Chitinophagales bacterium]|nr:DUF3857 domain-containing protein [Chitinophagales bacterium]